MKTAGITLVLITGLFCISVAYSETRCEYLHSKTLMKSRLSDIARERLTQEFVPMDRAIVEEQNELKTLLNEESEIKKANGTVDQALKKRIARLRHSINEGKIKFRENLERRRLEAFDELKKQLVAEIKLYAEKNNFQQINTETGVVYSKSGKLFTCEKQNDITAPFVEWLNAKYKDKT